MAILIVSSGYPELFAISDRLLLMRDSIIIRELDRSSIMDEQALELEVQGVSSRTRPTRPRGKP